MLTVSHGDKWHLDNLSAHHPHSSTSSLNKEIGGHITGFVSVPQTSSCSLVTEHATKEKLSYTLLGNAQLADVGNVYINFISSYWTLNI